ncbi:MULTISPECIES: hypothetical protein [unclassified Clostridium]|uniref:hypothetical protein n=1 Tax=unclassified Clostridium TaxID=2614128 RepID=UPI0025BBEE4C|nr:MULTISPECIES: hypothetical protein [unclassified Clostridium]
MSSENKTPNLELNQWNGNEYPKRTDFIEDNKKIDEAYKELKDAVQKGGKVASVNSKTGDVILKAEDIKTAAGITVENKLNELFQFADNGKKNIASVIGSPLSSSDTFDSLKSKIQTMKNTFASNLTAKGQSSSGSDTLNNLINKIPNINVGKKWATGTPNGNPFTVSNLSFKPSYIIIYQRYTSPYGGSSIYERVLVGTPENESLMIGGSGSFDYGSIGGGSANSSRYTIIDDGFTVNSSFSSTGYLKTLYICFE